MIRYLFSMIGSFLSGVFRTLAFKRECEKNGQLEEKSNQIVQTIENQQKIEETPKINSVNELSDILKKGSLAIAGLLFLCSCSNPMILCPTVKDWTREDQAQMEVDLQKLPNQSPVYGAMIDYHNMREQARACRNL